MKHVEIDMHFIKENWIRPILFVESENQAVDVFTKGLRSKLFHSFTSKIDMRDIQAPSWGVFLGVIGNYNMILKVVM